MTSNDQLGIEFLRTPVLLLKFFIFIHSQDFLFSVYLNFVLFYNSQKCEIYKVIKNISFHELGRSDFNRIVKITCTHRKENRVYHKSLTHNHESQWWMTLRVFDQWWFWFISRIFRSERLMIKSCLIHPLETDTLKFSQSDWVS